MDKQDRKAYMAYAVFAAVILLLGLATGCAKIGRFMNENEALSQITVEAATAHVLYEHPNWKKGTARITAGAMAIIDGKLEMDLASIDTFVRSEINWSRLTPEEQVLVSTLITQVRVDLRDSFLARGLKPDEQLVVVKQVLGWINGVATR